MKIDGKELSEETVKKACEAYGISFEKKFEPVAVCHLAVSIGEDKYLPIKLTMRARQSGEYSCEQSLEHAKESVEAIQSAIAFIESK